MRAAPRRVRGWRGWRGWRALPGLALLALVLMSAACGSPGVVIPPPPSGTIYLQGGALHASDGSPRWSSDLGARPPLIASAVAYVVTTQGDGDTFQNIARAVRLADGARLWQVTLPSAADSVGPDALTANGLLVLATAHYTSGLGEQLRLLALRTSDGGVAWQSAPIAVVRAPTVDTPVPFVSALAFASGRVVALADDTPHTAFAAAWNATDGSLAWRIPLPNARDYAGAGAALNVAGAVLTTVYDNPDGTGAMFGGLDVSAGKWAWSHSVDGAWLDLATPSALIAADTSTGTITALRPRDGTILWTRTLGAGMDHLFEDLAASDTTVFYRNYVLCPGAATGQSNDLQEMGCPRIYAVSLADGTVLWQRQLSLVSVYNATYSAYGDGVVYYHSFTSDAKAGEHFVLLALRATDGSQLWSRETGGLFELLAAGPGAVYGISGSPNAACSVVLTAYGSHDGSRLWQQPYTPCPQRFVGGLGRFPWIVVGQG